MASTIDKTFKTQKTAEESKQIVNKIITEVVALKSLVNTVDWQGNKLVFDSKIGDGFMETMDYSVHVHINLNFIGSMAKGQIEQVLDKEFLQLGDGK